MVQRWRGFVIKVRMHWLVCVEEKVTASQSARKLRKDLKTLSDRRFHLANARRSPMWQMIK